MSNSIKHPEAWKFFLEHARNIEKEPFINHLGKYRIPKPDKSGEFLYTDGPDTLFIKLLREWKKVPRTEEEILTHFCEFINSPICN